MKNVIFITREKVFGGSGAPSSRNLLFTKMLSEENIHVHLFSFDTRCCMNTSVQQVSDLICLHGEEPKNERILCRRAMRKLFLLCPMLFFLIRVYLIIKKLKGQTVILQDWTTTKSIDYGVLLIFRFLFRYKVYVDPNEVMAYLIEGRVTSNWKITNELIRIKQLFGDYLLRFYSGLIIISSKLEEKFSKVNKNYIKIPIISEVEDAKKVSLLPFKRGDTFKIGYFGTLQIYKEGLDLLYSSIKELKKKGLRIEIHFYGKINKPETNLINSMLSDLDGCAFYNGLVSNNQARQLMKDFHLLISTRRLTNQTKYGFSTKLAEYMSSGIPYLVTNIGDNSKYIQDGVNGYLIEPDSLNELTEKLEYIIANYEKEGTNIINNAMITTKTYFDYKVYKDQLVKFFFTDN